MDKTSVKTMVAGGDARFVRLFELNVRFFDEIHPDRLKAACPRFPDEVWALVSGCDAAVRRLSRDLSWLGVEVPKATMELPDVPGRLALLPWKELAKGLYWFALAVRFQAVRQCVDGGELRRIAEIAGPGARAFALERGNLMLGNRVRALFPDNPSLPLSERVEWVAAAALAGVMRGVDPSVAGRLALKAPPAFEKRMNMTRDFSIAEKRLLWLGMRNVIVKEALPEWANFFN